MTDFVPPTFLDVPRLLESSEPKPRSGWMGYGGGALILAALMASLVVAATEENKSLARLFCAVAMISVVITVGIITVGTVKRFRVAQAMVEAAGELVTLRRWQQAALVVEQILSQPAVTSALRAQSLVYLSAILLRYHRFDDAIAVQTHLIEQEALDPATGFGVRVGRAMAMLREDHLVDADRAMSELRRLEGDGESGGLALVDIYRDVKTGHPDEAIEIFQSKLPSLREQLGHRLGDAYALVSRAFDLRGREGEARSAWANATLLVPAAELVRRYPEVKVIAEKFPASPAPAGALG